MPLSQADLVSNTSCATQDFCNLDYGPESVWTSVSLLYKVTVCFRSRNVHKVPGT